MKPFRLILTSLPDGSYDITVSSHKLDAHLSFDEDGWNLDVFDSTKATDGKDSHLGVVNVTLLPSGGIDWAEVVDTLREWPTP